MQFKLTAISTKEADGEDVEVSVTRGNVETVEDVMYAFSQFLRAAGYSSFYHVGVVSDNGKQYWSSI